ncbi:TY-Chap domain-containing protein [Terrarubrum flagellatum]|uniref:TY-Chap domain-containing protein n=1 Tax=Terrirubrum flagellatum TaxID=2895980 RepID=UPI003145213D
MRITTSFAIGVAFAQLLAASLSVTAQTPSVVSRVSAALQNVSDLIRPGRVGYATIWDGNKYVQCRRAAQKEMRCEASGATMQPSLRRVLTPERLTRLDTLGWRLDPSFGNYVRVFPAETTAIRIAEQITTALADGYDAKIAALEVETKWVADTPCPPRNGPTQNLAGMVSDAPSMRATSVRACTYKPDAIAEATQPANSAAELFASQGATTASEIQRLRINSERRVYVIFSADIGYVQCAPESSVAIYCEAQSAESWPALAALLTPERLAFLRQAGFSDPGRSPNYWRSYSLDQYDEAAIARELLTVLYEVYGYRGATKLKISTE